MIIAVEGLDGSGKTTVARILAGLVGGAYAALPPPKLTLSNTSLFANLQSEVRYLYYLSGVVALAEMARDHDILVTDRFVASAHALHINISTVLAEGLRGLSLPVPDVTFYLDVDEKTRIERLKNRPTRLDAFEMLLATDDAFRERVAARMRASPRTYIISTNDRPPQLVAQAAREIWRGLDGSTGRLRRHG